MRRTWPSPLAGFAVVALAVLAALPAPAGAAADDEAVRRQVLELNQLTGDDPVDGAYKALTDDPKAAARVLAVAKTMLKDKPPPFDYNAAYLLGHLAERKKDIPGAAAFYRVCINQATRLQSGQKISQAYVSLIGLYYDNQKYEDSTRACKEFLEIKSDDSKPRVYLLAADAEEDGEPGFLETESYDPVRRQKPGVHHLMIQSIARQGKVAEALKMVDSLLKDRKNDWLNLQLKGWVYRDAGRYGEAAKVYEEVLGMVAKDKELEPAEKEKYSERYQYYLSNIYAELNQIDKAAGQLKALLAKKPDNPTYNNDLGFIWADHDMNLEEAEKLIRKALAEDRKLRKKDNLKPEEDRDNGAYLDSLGWVLYKQKKYREAKDVLQKAVEDKDNQSIEIYDHLGDVLWALKEKDKAIDAWKKGLACTPAGKRDQDRRALVEKKLKANK